MAKRAPKPAAKAPPPDEGTRERVLTAALGLFQSRGVAATTMRDIARAADLSLGAAYYYFPSKDALVFAYYEQNQAHLEAEAARAGGSVRAQLGALFHARLVSVAPQRKMLAAIVHRLVDPGDPLSAFSEQQRAVRERAVAVFEHALAGAHLPPRVRLLASHALWILLMAFLLVFVHDDSPDQTRTHRLADDALDMIVPLLPFAATPFGAPLVDSVLDSLARAGIHLAPAH